MFRLSASVFLNLLKIGFPEHESQVGFNSKSTSKVPSPLSIGIVLISDFERLSVLPHSFVTVIVALALDCVVPVIVQVPSLYFPKQVRVPFLSSDQPT